MKLKTMLHEEIQNEFESLRKMELGTETYKVTVNGLAQLMDRAIELEKIDVDVQEKSIDREIENDFKLKQMRDENRDRLIKNSITVAGIIIPVTVTIWGTIKTLKFETEGTVTTIMGRGFINKLIPKK